MVGPLVKPGRRLFVAMTGVSGSGKSTLARRLRDLRGDIEVIEVDDHFRDDYDHIVLSGRGSWEDREAFDYDAMMRNIEERLRSSSARVLLVEGCAVADCPDLLGSLDALIIVDVAQEIARFRRANRVWRPDAAPDPPGYFDAHVWPTHVSRQSALADVACRVLRLDGAEPLEILVDRTVDWIDQLLSDGP